MSVGSLQPAAIYCRISHDAEGQGLGVARQELSCRRLATNLGLEAVEVYIDNDISAYNGMHRPAYDQMLRRLRDGQFAAVIAWDCDRLHRSTRELEDFIDVLDVVSTPVLTVTAGEVDFTTATGRMQARLKGSISRYESEHKTERVSAAHANLAEAGRWKGGPRPYGYDVYRDNYGRPLRDGRLAVLADEAAIVREAAARVLAGDSLYGVCNDLNARKVPTAQGARWRTQTLRRILTNPTTIGKREYRGKIVADALWPPLLSEDDWFQLRARLKRTRPDRRHTTSGEPSRPRRHLLSGGIAVCGLCGTRLYAHMRQSGAPSYNCMTGPDTNGCGGVSCSARALDRLVTEAVLSRYATDPTASSAGDDVAAKPAVERATDHGSRPGIAELARLFADGYLSHAAWQVVQAGIDATERPPTAAHRAERPPHAALQIGWDQLPLHRRRERISHLIVEVVVSPTTQRGPEFDARRVKICWHR